MSSSPSYDSDTTGSGDSIDTDRLASSTETDTSDTGGSGDGGLLSGSTRETLAKFAAAPGAFILTYVVREVVFRPAAAGLGLIDLGLSLVRDGWAMIPDLLFGTPTNPGPLTDAAETVFIIPRSVTGALENSLAGLGLGAPLVFAFGILIQTAFLFALLFGGHAVLVSAIPGASGVTNTVGEVWGRIR
ncbi:hypothetical protein [Halobaculum marinum]|uniref:Yip1 domain-containing protein n=1 Tax=Halobaculum marinum TaxID=3031996 RepID=A0ABD5WR69_9EURY|nr:hypothetical protein [Halobaculum sp. DT55]